MLADGTFVLIVDEIPPTSNKIYFNKGSTRILTKTAKAYKTRAVRFLWEHFEDEMNGILDRVGDTEFLQVEFRFFFETIVNKGWLTGKAQERYKKVDASNRVKLLEDSLALALGVDDRRFQITASKHMDPDDPRVEIHLTRRKPEEYGVPAEYLVGRPVPGVRDVQE